MRADSSNRHTHGCHSDRVTDTHAWLSLRAPTRVTDVHARLSLQYRTLCIVHSRTSWRLATRARPLDCLCWPLAVSGSSTVPVQVRRRRSGRASAVRSRAERRAAHRSSGCTRRCCSLHHCSTERASARHRSMSTSARAFAVTSAVISSSSGCSSPRLVKCVAAHSAPPRAS